MESGEELRIGFSSMLGRSRPGLKGDIFSSESVHIIDHTTLSTRHRSEIPSVQRALWSVLSQPSIAACGNTVSDNRATDTESSPQLHNFFYPTIKFPRSVSATATTY